MSTPSPSWLHNQKKSELVALAEKVGLEDFKSLRKIELEHALDEHMRANQSALAKNSYLNAVIKSTTAPSSPVKKEDAIALIPNEETRKPRQRRQTRAKEEIEPFSSSEPEQSRSLISRGPRTSISFTSPLTLPPSPSVVVDQIDQKTANIRSELHAAWLRSGIVNYLQSLRDQLSTIPVEALAIFVEICGVEGLVFPIRYFGAIPASSLLHTPAIPIKVPDLFKLLEPEFWSTSSLWMATSLLLPLILSYFFNLKLKSRNGSLRGKAATGNFDLMTFNVTKALITWLVYSKGMRLGGLLGDDSVEKIQEAIPGGHIGVLIGTGIGALISVYQAVLQN